MEKITMISVVFLLLVLFFSSSKASIEYNVLKLGAKSNGKTDSTKAFLQAWTSACNSDYSATIHVPRGRYLLNNIVFNGQDCKNYEITFQIEGTLVAPSDYNIIGKSQDWIKFKDVNGVKIYGGTLDGRGTGLWTCKLASKGCPHGATSLKIGNSKNVVIQGLSSVNSQKFHIVIHESENVYLQGMTITASGNSPNTDGIHVEASKGVTITEADIGTGDDCISIGPGTKNLWIEHINCGPGHGISIGSLGKVFNENGVQNVTVKTVAFTGTQNGLRIKTWARPSKGFVRHVLFENATMINVENPVIIDQNYCPGRQNCPNQVSGVKISDVTYRGVRGSSATEFAVKFDCSSKKPCSGIILDKVHLTYGKKPARSSCASVDGSTYNEVQPSSCL
ncbi:hypothetical protein AQUCO_02300144v1 [Aquilegia coerulea]|uniref:Polygalacturonase n=1 Tax=Aquilegia coerulea TaxID=218851 RepID=A0A2G5DC93_AQUCA|nr:hypothetical protein AQUCO_02300144v1 [Aquilegia coerulea]